MAKRPKSSSHILNASSNLLGICFIILTSLKILRESEKTMIDEITLLATIIFMSSCGFSFLSIRKENGAAIYLEKIAEYAFMMGLVLLFLTAILFSFNVIN